MRTRDRSKREISLGLLCLFAAGYMSVLVTSLS